MDKKFVVEFISKHGQTKRGKTTTKKLDNFVITAKTAFNAKGIALNTYSADIEEILSVKELELTTDEIVNQIMGSL